MKCSISGAKMGFGRFSISSATLDSLNLLASFRVVLQRHTRSNVIQSWEGKPEGKDPRETEVSIFDRGWPIPGSRG